MTKTNITDIRAMPRQQVDKKLRADSTNVAVSLDGETVIDPTDPRTVEIRSVRVRDMAPDTQFLEFRVSVPLNDDTVSEMSPLYAATETDETPTTDTDGDEDGTDGHTTAHSDDGEEVVEPSVTWSFSDGPP